MKKFRVLSLITVLMMTLLMACGNGTSSTTEKTDVNSKAESSTEYDGTVNICMSSWIGYGPLYVAKEKGIFKKNGVDVNLQTIESVADINSSLASGSSQGSVVATGTFVIGQSAGIDQVQVLTLDDSYGGDGVVANKDINSFKDLKGKKVAVSKDGDTSTLLFYSLLDKNGMTQDDVEICNMSPGDAGAAFVGGSVDAAVTYEPWLTNSLKTDFGKMLISSEETPGLINDVLCFKRDFYEKYPDTVQKIVDSWFEALDYVNANQDECNKIMADSQGMMLDDFVACLPTVRFYDKEKNKEYFNNKEINSITKETADIWAELKLINKSEDNYDKCIDSKFINK